VSKLRSAAVLALLSGGFLASELAVAQQRPAAQPAPPAPPPAAAPAAPAVSAEPERTTATYGDWVLRCERVGENPRSCEVAQVLVVQGQQQPIAQLAIGRAARGQPLTFTVQVPVSVTFGGPLRIVGDDREPLVVPLEWRRCFAGGCFADTQLREDAVLRRLRGRVDPGRIEYRDATGRDLALAFSFRGLAPALDALNRE
jgi:invasion protein IalB